MGYIKTIAIAFIISFCIITFITSNRLRKEIFDILNLKLGKSKFRIYHIFVILITLIIILYSSKLLYKLNIVEKIIERRVAS